MVRFDCGCIVAWLIASRAGLKTGAAAYLKRRVEAGNTVLVDVDLVERAVSRIEAMAGLKPHSVRPARDKGGSSSPMPVMGRSRRPQCVESERWPGFPRGQLSRSAQCLTGGNKLCRGEQVPADSLLSRDSRGSTTRLKAE